MVDKKPIIKNKSKKSEKLSKSPSTKSPLKKIAKNEIEDSKTSVTPQNLRTKNNANIKLVIWSIFVIGLIGAIGLYYYQLELKKLNDTDNDKFTKLEQKIESLQLDLTTNLAADQTNKIEKINNNLSQVLTANSTLSEQNQTLMKKIESISNLNKQIPIDKNSVSNFNEERRKNMEIEKNKLMLAIKKSQTAVKSLEKQLRRNDLNRNITLDLNNIKSAFLQGEPFGNALTKISEELNVFIPPDIENKAKTGIETIEQLRSSFPKEARNALKVFKTAKKKQTIATSILFFIKSNITTRSLKPISGNSVDAILSRSEKYLKLHKLEKALEEMQNLPENSKDSMKNWIMEAQIHNRTTKELEKLFKKISELRDSND